jgi:anthranilate phosphoribosyltransferase
MSLSRYIQQIALPDREQGGLSESDAHDLLAALLDGGASDLEVGAVLMGLCMRQISANELAGFSRALAARTYALRRPVPSLKPLVFASCNGVRDEPNLLPLLALMLRRLRVPVLLHGAMDSGGGVAAVYVLRHLGIMPCATLVQAQKALDEEQLAFVPTAALCPAVASLLALRHMLGIPNVAHILVRLIDPFQGEGVRVISSGPPASSAQMERALIESEQEALLLLGTEGEPFANPRQRPRIAQVGEGIASVLFEEESLPTRGVVGLPKGSDAATTARWIRLALNGEASVPYPLVNQLACCLYVSGYTEDMNQAKAIAAVEAGGLGAPSHPGSRSKASLRDSGAAS